MSEFAVNGNRVYLTCASHPAESKIMLGKRAGTSYGRAPSAHELNAWFDTHANCPGAPDCFKLAYESNVNWDQLPQAAPVEKHVRLELVKTS